MSAKEGKLPARIPIALQLYSAREEKAFDIPPRRNLDSTPGVPEAITFQLKPGTEIEHVAVVVTSVRLNSDRERDSRYRGVGIVTIPQPGSPTT